MKAVIMAGGEGTRMRPLTCDIPKPMARLCGRPIIEYIMDLLIENDVDEAVVTLKYLPQIIKDNFPTNTYKGLKLTFVEEGISLKTAGSVKNAAKNFNEPFFVISGDAMCDFELNKIMAHHKSISALATIVLSKVNDPREYGLVKMNDKGIVEGFIEKPGWGQVTSDLANTGIYILSPEILEQIPDNEPFDFAQDLFPKMIQKNMQINAYQAHGYWCDIGDLQAYLHCQYDMLNCKVKCDLQALGAGVYSKNSVLPVGNYKLIPPVYIGENVELESGAEIGPNTIIDDGCLVGKDAKIRYSVMLKNSYVSSDSEMTSAILGTGATIKRNATMYEFSATGTGVIIGKNASVRPNVLIWPEKSVSDGTTAYKNVKYGKFSRDIFDDDGISGESGIELTPEVCARLGSSIGSTHAGRKTGIAFDGTRNSKILKLAIMSGLMSAGCHVWDFGECFEAQLSFFTSFCGLGMGIYISDGVETSIKICGEGGLSLPRFLEREVEARLAKGEFNRCGSESCRDIADMSSIQMIYQQELCRQASYGLVGQSAGIECENEQVARILRESLDRLGCECSSKVVLKINSEGTILKIIDKTCGDISYEKLLAICCINELQSDRDIALPYDAPQFLNSLAKRYNKRVLRYLRSPADNADSEARRLSMKQAWVRDGLFMAVRILSIMNERGMTLAQLLREVPDFYVHRKILKIDISPTQLSEYLGLDSNEINSGKEGVTLKRDNGRLLITPTRRGDKIKLFAEASNMETAEELCAEIENKVKANSPHK
ncbi:MAG: sugar phosphate nucleotidyltransferase [Oscillospiraceae bacterium]